MQKKCVGTDVAQDHDVIVRQSLRVEGELLRGYAAGHMVKLECGRHECFVQILSAGLVHRTGEEIPSFEVGAARDHDSPAQKNANTSHHGLLSGQEIRETFVPRIERQVCQLPATSLPAY